MKKILQYLALAAAAGIFIVSCSPAETNFDRSLMVGKWRSTQYFSTAPTTPHTVYDVFNNDGTGKTWDVTDDVTEDEAQAFKWTLSGATLTLTHYIETTGQYGVPKPYTVTELTQTRLVYKDAGGTTISCTRAD